MSDQKGTRKELRDVLDLLAKALRRAHAIDRSMTGTSGYVWKAPVDLNARFSELIGVIEDWWNMVRLDES